MSIHIGVRRSFAAVVAAAGLACAALVPSASAQMFPEVVLTTQSVEAIISTFPEVKAKANELNAAYNVPESDDVASTWGAWLAYGDAMSQFNAIIQPYGFTDFQNWVQTLVSVSIAYSFAKNGPQMDASMQAAVDQIQNNPNLSDAQKKMMIEQIQASMGAMSAMQPSQANIDAVTPYLDQIAEALEM